MGIISLVSTGTSTFSTLTYGEAKRIVGRIVGRSAKSDDVGAGDAIRMAINKINEYNWEYLTVRGSDISVVAGTSAYSLPAPFKDHYSMRLVANSRPLGFIRQSEYDNLNYPPTSGVPHSYSVFGQALTNQINLLPTPSIDDTLEYRYYRPMAVPVSESETLDCPSWMERFIISFAQSLVGMWQGVDNQRIQLLQVAAEDALRGSLSADRNSAGEDAGFLSQMQHANPGYDVNHAQYWIVGDE